MLYFGVKEKGRAGHFLYDERLRHVGDPALFARLVELGIDGVRCPVDTRREGAARVTLADEFTILSFWDYSGDSRPGSNSNFIETGVHSFEEMLERARRAFPSLFARFHFEITNEEG